MVNRNEIRYVGVDGCPLGWFSVGFTQDGQWDHHACATFQELLDHYADAEIILVDIPIGLLAGPGGRHCDLAARAHLGEPRRRSVFPAPTRQTVQQVAMNPNDYPAASRIERRCAMRGLQKQAFYITPKIGELDALLPRANAPQVKEVHPEVCFWALNHREAMQHKKKARGQVGVQERIDVLSDVRAERRTQEIFDAACADFMRRDVARDDILDALVAAVTARRGWPNNLQTLPGNPPEDARGLPMEMVFWELSPPC